MKGGSREWGNRGKERADKERERKKLSPEAVKENAQMLCRIRKHRYYDQNRVNLFKYSTFIISTGELNVST